VLVSSKVYYLFVWISGIKEHRDIGKVPNSAQLLLVLVIAERTGKNTLHVVNGPNKCDGGRLSQSLISPS
jgi:hypothetical protein